MDNIKILWADDEIDLLKPHIIFLTQKGYTVKTVISGDKALEEVQNDIYDIVFLDENMPGLSGLETLNRIKKSIPSLPIVMITKSEEEYIMEEAIGSKIADYLIKPVNPNQILLTIKKNVNVDRIISEKTTSQYRQQFTQLSDEINRANSENDWIDIYKKLVYWELELEKFSDNTMDEVLKMQKEEADNSFCKFIKRNYEKWFSGAEKPLLSPSIFKEKVFPHLNQKPVYVILIDNLRYDQWKTIRPLLSSDYNIEEDEVFYSILPTATQYSRNAMFSGLMPAEIKKMYPDLWIEEDDEESKNVNEKQLLEKQFKRVGITPKLYFEKIFTNKEGEKLLGKIKNLNSNDLNVLIFNFVDILSHSRTDSKMIRELADDESAYRSLTKSWFEHSPLKELFNELKSQDCKIIITTDHGSVKISNPIKVVGDKKTSTNLRYKQGKALKYKEKDVFSIQKPERAFLPTMNLSSSYIFAQGKDFLAYPNNYNYYVNYYKDTFQHGGVSMEEMLIPIITMSSKK